MSTPSQSDSEQNMTPTEMSKYLLNKQKDLLLRESVERVYTGAEERAELTAEVLAGRASVVALKATLKAQKQIENFYLMLSENLGPGYRHAADLMFWTMKHILPVLKGPPHVRSNDTGLFTDDLITALRKADGSTAQTLLRQLRECADNKDVARLAAEVRLKYKGKWEEAKEDANVAEHAEEEETGAVSWEASDYEDANTGGGAPLTPH